MSLNIVNNIKIILATLLVGSFVARQRRGKLIKRRNISHYFLLGTQFTRFFLMITASALNCVQFRFSPIFLCFKFALCGTMNTCASL